MVGRGCGNFMISAGNSSGLDLHSNTEERFEVHFLNDYLELLDHFFFATSRSPMKGSVYAIILYYWDIRICLI